MLKSLRIDQGLREICAMRYAHDPRISEAASMLMLAQTGVQIDDASIDRLAADLCSMAEELSLHPEDVQAALMHHEPQLKDQIF